VLLDPVGSERAMTVLALPLEAAQQQWPVRVGAGNGFDT
jgi:hypothetical protein